MLFIELKLRWLWHLTAAASALLAIASLGGFRPAILSHLWQRFLKYSENHFYRNLLGLVGIYFSLACVAKFLQLYTLQLNALDFWLHEDILRNLADQGAGLLTRFAPHGFGFTQHGAIHPSLIFYFIAPFAWIFSATWTALCFNPLVLSLAAGLVALLAQPAWGKGQALLLAFAFMISSPVNGTLMYDMHPEAAYPLFVFLWAYGLNSQGPRRACFWIGLLGGLTIKEDGFLVFLPLSAALAMSKGLRHRDVLWTALSAVVATSIDLFLIHEWKTGALGPQIFFDQNVTVPQGTPWFHGHQVDSLSSFQTILAELFKKHGGALGAMKAIASFFISRPWLSLLILFPWILRRKELAILTLPLGAIYALIGGGASQLFLYYPMPLFACLWLLCLDWPRFNTSSATTSKVFWTAVFCLGIDTGGLTFYIPTKELFTLRREAKTLAQCLPDHPTPSTLVTTPLLPFVSREMILTSFFPATEIARAPLTAAFFAVDRASYETPKDGLVALKGWLDSSPEWVALDSNCQPLEGPATGSVQLYLRRKTE